MKRKPIDRARRAFPARDRTSSTVQGILALLFWSTTVAFSRSLTERLGTFTAASYIFLLAGGVSCAYLIVTLKFRELFRLPMSYLLGCGALFIVYMTSLYLAIGTASNREQVLEVGLVNYLWPSMTLVIAVPILRRKARATLIIGCILAFGGLLLAASQGADSSKVFLWNPKGSWLPYALAFVAAISWALYSNLTRLLARDATSGAVPLFLLASGLTLAALRFFYTETTQWTTQSAFELAYMATFPTVLAYAFWDTAMRRGHMILVASLSYLTPLLSIIIGSTYLGVETEWNLWIGCLLVIAGSVTCKMSVEEAP